jgi:8-oxo-dGTP diphosphatase
MDRRQVSCALIINEKKILACLRGADFDNQGRWEFPGGKVELGETPEECIVREVKEELLVDVVVRKKLEEVDYDYDTHKITLVPFICEIEEGIPVPVEHEIIEWFDIVDFEKFDWSGADRVMFVKNKNTLECLFI